MDESEDIDSLIGLVTATDMDDPSTLDGIFSYSIQSQASTFPFKIDSGTGIDYHQLSILLIQARFACLRCAAGGHIVSTGGALWAPRLTIIN